MTQNNITVNEIYTAYAAVLAYQIENAYKSGDNSREDLEKLVEEFKTRETFEYTSHHLPSSLEYIDSFYDPGLSTSGVALQDTNTGEIIIGYTGSNGQIPIDKDWWLADGIGILFGTGIHLKPAYDFYEDIRFRYGDNIILGGHSLGGNIAQAVALEYNVAKTVVYNAAPLYVDIININRALKNKMDDFSGSVIRFRTSEDPLNRWASDYSHSTYLGPEYIITNGKGHDMHFFLGDVEYQHIINTLKQHFGEDQIKSQQLAESVYRDESWNLKGLEGKSTFNLGKYLEGFVNHTFSVKESKIPSYKRMSRVNIDKILQKTATFFNKPRSFFENFTATFEQGFIRGQTGLWGIITNRYRLTGTDEDDLIKGKDGNDILKGEGGNDQLEGMAGDDNLSGGEGHDLLKGGKGNDSLNGGKGHDQLEGGDGDDRLEAGSGNDKLYGEKGNDRLEAGEGNDVLDGGIGHDYISGGAGDDIYVFRLGGGSDVLSDSQGTNLLYFESGIDFTDMRAYKLSGSDVVLKFQKGEGNAITIRHFTSDTNYRNFFLMLSDGSVLHAEDAESPFRYLEGTDEDDTIYTILESSSIQAGDGNDKLHGSKGSDVLEGEDGDDHLEGNDGDDLLNGGYGKDHLAGGKGDDTYQFGRDFGSDTISDSEGKNTIEFVGDILPTHVYVSKTDSSADLTLSILDSQDRVKITGFRHYDINKNFNLKFTDGTVMTLRDARSPLRRVVGSSEGETLNVSMSGMESILFGLSGNDTLNGSTGADTLNGGAGHDTLKGEGGQDVLEGGTGQDHLYGGADNDTYLFQKGHGVDRIYDNQGINVLRFTDQTKASDYKLYRHGNWDVSLKNDMTGDEIQLNGFLLDDTSYRRVILTFSDGTEMRPEDEGSLFKTIHGKKENDYLSAIYENSTLLGYEGNDSLNGSSGQDVLKGGDGDDRLEGKRGQDALEGGAGQDHLYGGAENDTYLFQKGHGVDRIYDNQGINVLRFTDQTKASDYKLYRHGNWDVSLKNDMTGDEIQLNGFLLDDTSYRRVILTFSDGTEMRPEDEGSLFKTIHGKKENDYLSAIYENSTLLGYEGNDSLNGSSGNDALKGGDGDDLLNAGWGNDTLDGGIGNDRLEGNFGDDTYLFNLGDGQDRVFDTVGQNILHFGEKILPEHLKLTKVNYDLNIDYQETDRVTLSSYFYSSIYQNFSLSFANKQTATINADGLTLNITPAPVEEKVEETPVSETVLTPEVTATQATPAETVTTETLASTEGEVVVQSVPVEISGTTAETASEVFEVEDVTKFSEGVLATYPTANTGETMAYIALPLPDVTNQVVGQ